MAAPSIGLARAVKSLSPGYFALVMGTGIVSIGLHEVGFATASRVLLVIAAISHVVLWVLYAWRAIAYQDALLGNLRNPETAFSYFTVVAGTDVLAVRLFLAGRPEIALPLVLFAALLWFVFGYTLPWQVFLTRDGKPILARTNGTWFVWAVASQSLAIGLAQARPFTEGQVAVWTGMLAVLSWSVGVALYAGIAVLVMLRIVNFGITPEAFEPPYWVAMGALAIAVVAGSSIVGMGPTPMVDATRALISGTVAVFWGFCLWLIPVLVGAGVWRHAVHRVPLRYEPSLWSIVFPVGMFAVASINLGRVDHLPMVERIGEVGVAVALAVWTVVFAAMLTHIVSGLRRRREREKLA